MSAEIASLKPRLLAMLGGVAPGALAETNWTAIDAMAAQHRLQPLLAYRFEQADGTWQAPAAIAQTWRAARHKAGLASLAQQAALRLAAERLTAAGIAYTALKGPRLAWRCYPEAGLRPMRDLDLLVAGSEILRAADVLRDAGFAMDADAAMVAEALATDKHLPVLLHRGLGVALELHHRLSEPHGRRAYRLPQLDPGEVLARSEPIMLAGCTVTCPEPTDLLAHLMVHALYGHRLDCGPLVLADIHFLLASEPVSAERLREQAEQGGWLRGAALLLALTERYFGSQPITPATITDAPPVAMLSAAEEALLQDFDKREHAEALADVLAARSPGALTASLGRRLRPAQHVVHREAEGRAGWRFWFVWAGRRLRRLGARLVDRRAGREARSAAALLRWLQS